MHAQIDILLFSPWKRACPNATLHQQVAKGAKDSLTEVIRSGDLISYTAEEGVRWLGEVQLFLQAP